MNVIAVQVVCIVSDIVWKMIMVEGEWARMSGLGGDLSSHLTDPALGILHKFRANSMTIY